MSAVTCPRYFHPIIWPTLTSQISSLILTTVHSVFLHIQFLKLQLRSLSLQTQKPYPPFRCEPPANNYVSRFEQKHSKWRKGEWCVRFERNKLNFSQSSRIFVRFFYISFKFHRKPNWVSLNPAKFAVPIRFGGPFHRWIVHHAIWQCAIEGNTNVQKHYSCVCPSQ